MCKYIVISLIFVVILLGLTIFIGPVVGDILRDLGAEWK